MNNPQYKYEIWLKVNEHNIESDKSFSKEY